MGKKKKRKKKRKGKSSKSSNRSKYPLDVIGSLFNFGIDGVKKRFSLKVSKHSKYPELVQLNYSNLKSDFSKRVVQECRNLIIKKSENPLNYEIISLGFVKFFNYRDTRSPKIPKKNFNDVVKVYEKLDGSIMILYWYNNEWIVSSNNSPDASGVIRSISKSIGELFWDIFNELKYKKPKYTTKCYMFEMISIDLLQLVQYKENKLILIGARDMKTLKEMEIEEIGMSNGWEVVEKVKKFNSFDEVRNETEKFSAFKNEGYVLTFKSNMSHLHFERVKVKSPHHVYITNLKNTKDGDPKQLQFLFNLIFTKEDSEFLLYFPKYKEKFLKIKKEFEEWCKFLKEFFTSKESKDFSFSNSIMKKLEKVFDEKGEESDVVVLDYLVNEKFSYKGIFEAMKKYNYVGMKFSKSLNIAYENIVKKVDNSKQMNVFEIIQGECKKKFPKVKLKLYGSSFYGLSIDSSDLDICILKFNLSKINDIIGILKKLKMKNIKFFDYKKVLKFEIESSVESDVLNENAISCDISFSDKNLKKSNLVKKFIKIGQNGEFFSKLVVLIKFVVKRKFKWIKRNREIYVNSFTITLMIIFFLQQRNILPRGIEFEKKKIRNLRDGKSLIIGKEFVKFFEFFCNFLACDVDSKIISIRKGEFVSLKDSKINQTKDSALYVEDPIEISENTARTINKKSLEIFKEKFKEMLSIKGEEKLKEYFG